MSFSPLSSSLNWMDCIAWSRFLDDNEIVFWWNSIKRSLKIFVKYPSGKETPCTIEYSDMLSGIPLDMQMLSYLIHPDITLWQYGLQDGCCINLSVQGLVGGAETDACMCRKCSVLSIFFQLAEDELLDECVSCGEYANTYCNDCKLSCCQVCDKQWPKHPKRSRHKTKVCNTTTKTDYTCMVTFHMRTTPYIATTSEKQLHYKPTTTIPRLRKAYT